MAAQGNDAARDLRKDDRRWKRKARIFVPRSAALIYWMRSLLNTRPVERANEKLVAEAVPGLPSERQVLCSAHLLNRGCEAGRFT